MIYLRKFFRVELASNDVDEKAFADVSTLTAVQQPVLLQNLCWPSPVGVKSDGEYIKKYLMRPRRAGSSWRVHHGVNDGLMRVAVDRRARQFYALVSCWVQTPPNSLFFGD